MEHFRKGWVAPNLVTEGEAQALAAAAGFAPVETVDLTGYLEIRRARATTRLNADALLGLAAGRE